MTCTLGQDKCECLGGSFLTLRMVCDNWHVPEQPLHEVHKTNIRNWNMLALPIRERCLQHLRRFMHDALDVVEHWRDQAARGVAIGSDRIRFHMDEGMQIRNALRAVVTDSELPPMKQPGGEIGRNWDNYYVGALYALCDEKPNG